MLKIKEYRYVIAALFAIWSMAHSNLLSAQCNFSVRAVMQKESDCQSNGIIEVSLSGPDVDDGYIEINDAKFGISSTTTTYIQTPVSNNGIITNVPPGTYDVSVLVYCKRSNSWVAETFSSVTVTGSYVVPNINNIKILSANIQKSLKCEATGSIPINVEGGKPPYVITMSAAPAGYSGPTTFIHATEGVFTIDNLPAGSYSFEVQDDCTYTLHGIPPATVGEIQPLYTLGPITHTASCATDGVIPIIVKDGAAPYTIEMVSHPPAYTGQESFTMLTDGTLDITGLPNGNYTFKVKDKCYEETLTAIVNDIPFDASRGTTKGTTTCSSSGSVNVSMQGGQPPYTVTVTSAPACFANPLPWSQTYPASGTQTVGGLCEGSYTIEISDGCGNKKIFAGISINASHLSASVKSLTPANASCATTGKAAIEITGGQKPYKISLVSTTSTYYSDPGTQTTNSNSYTIDNLSPGVYTYKIEDDCGEEQTVSFTITYVPMSATAQTIVSAFECLATGQLLITVTNGKPPYTVDMFNHTVFSPPPAYSGPFNGFQPTSPPNGNVFEINNLPNGIYEFEIIDACGERDTVVGLVDSLPVNYPYDFYHNYFLHSDPKDSNCNDVVIRRNDNATGSLGYYWNNNPGSYYEVAFAEDTAIQDNTYPPPQGLLDTLDWNPVTSDRDSTFTLSRTYCDMRTNDGYVVVFLRVIDGTNGFLCGVSTDTVRMDEIKTRLRAPFDQSCDGYSIKFEHEGLFCYPYSWQLLDINNSNNVVKTASGINDSRQTVIAIPYGKHVFKFTDNEGCFWYSDTLEYYWSPPPAVDFDVERGCGVYDLTFKINDVCPPYQWEFYSLINGMFAQGNATATGYKRKITDLEFDKDYYLKITYSNGQKDTTILINESATFYHNYQISFEPSYCLPDTGKGTVFIYRDVTMPNFEQGSYIEFISGPTTPIHTYIPILTNTIDKVYPFSVDSLAFEIQDILPGVYQFQVTDTCGFAHLLTLKYDIATLDGLGYTKEETCGGVKILPRGTIYLGSVPQPTYFRISAAPPGIAVDPSSVTSTGIPNYLFLPESGEYEIQVSADSSPTSCPFDKFKIDYTKLSVSLDADSTEAYVCEAGGDGYIKVVRKGGIGPFEYELFDQGVSVGRNSTGRFSYGEPGETYTIRIKDEGCQVSFDQNITLINLATERFIYGVFDYCPGDVIELNSLPVNTSGYYWEGPNGFSSNDQFPRIPAADSTHQGIYTLSIYPEGCTGAITQTVSATNHKPELPTADAARIICLNTQADPLNATASSPDYQLKWYGTNGTSVLSSAPVPSTANVDTITYYVSQVSTIWGCESDKIPVQAEISDLPSIDLFAESPVICPGMIPTIVLPQTDAGYTYSVYDVRQGGNLIAGGYSFGDTVKISTGVPINDATTFYVEVIDNNTCVSPDRKSVVSSTENYLRILTDVLPEIQRGKPFSIHLQSNAVEPGVYSSDYGLPWNFRLTASGIITGTLPANGYFDPTTFDIRLKDANGCIATKEYLLKSEPFVPNTFTPNGDGHNDVFMKGHHLIIFDRLGVVIFEGKDGWDGKRNNGKKAPPDTYFYILDYKHDDGLISKRKGYITVLEREGK